MTETALVAQPAGHMTEPDILERLKVVGDALAPEAKMSASELQLFAMVAARNGLDPFARQIHAIRRQGKLTFQTGIDGYRSTAARTGEYDGSDEPEYGPIVDKPFPHPEWARVTVYRLVGGERRPQSATAWFDEFMPGPPNDFMWKKMPRNQLAKCAEALALRKAFPYVLADIFVTEEMDQADSRAAADAEAQRIASLPTAGDRLAARRAAIEGQAAGDGAPGEPDEPARVVQGDVVEGEAREVIADQVAEPAEEPSACGAPSPFTEGATCALESGHKHNHKSGNRETWAPGR